MVYVDIRPRWYSDIYSYSVDHSTVLVLEISVCVKSALESKR